MRVGALLPNAGPKATPENIVTVARWAEELGYHSVWLTEHIILPERVESFYPYRANARWDYPADTLWLDPLVTLSLAAAVAPSVHLGTSIMVVPLRNPIILAKQWATLDYLSGGRALLGIGAGWMEEEFNLIGQSFANRGKRVLEMVRLMRELWTGETVDFKGEFYQVSGARQQPRPVRGTIPVVWGGHTDAALRRVARMGDGWHPTQIAVEQLREGVQKLRQYCEQYGRDPKTLQIIARPGNTYRVTPETHAQHEEIGVTELVVDTLIKDPDLQNQREEMERVAEIVGLQRRS